MHNQDLGFILHTIGAFLARILLQGKIFFFSLRAIFRESSFIRTPHRARKKTGAQNQSARLIETTRKIPFCSL